LKCPSLQRWGLKSDGDATEASDTNNSREWFLSQTVINGCAFCRPTCRRLWVGARNTFMVRDGIIKTACSLLGKIKMIANYWERGLTPAMAQSKNDTTQNESTTNESTKHQQIQLTIAAYFYPSTAPRSTFLANTILLESSWHIKFVTSVSASS
jgi:hypothetical protein